MVDKDNYSKPTWVVRTLLHTFMAKVDAGIIDFSIEKTNKWTRDSEDGRYKYLYVIIAPMKFINELLIDVIGAMIQVVGASTAPKISRRSKSGSMKSSDLLALPEANVGTSHRDKKAEPNERRPINVLAYRKKVSKSTVSLSSIAGAVSTAANITRRKASSRHADDEPSSSLVFCVDVRLNQHTVDDVTWFNLYTMLNDRIEAWKNGQLKSLGGTLKFQRRNVEGGQVAVISIEIPMDVVKISSAELAPAPIPDGSTGGSSIVPGLAAEGSAAAIPNANANAEALSIITTPVIQQTPSAATHGSSQPTANIESSTNATTAAADASSLSSATGTTSFSSSSARRPSRVLVTRVSGSNNSINSMTYNNNNLRRSRELFNSINNSSRSNSHNNHITGTVDSHNNHITGTVAVAVAQEGSALANSSTRGHHHPHIIASPPHANTTVAAAGAATAGTATATATAGTTCSTTAEQQPSSSSSSSIKLLSVVTDFVSSLFSSSQPSSSSGLVGGGNKGGGKNNRVAPAVGGDDEVEIEEWDGSSLSKGGCIAVSTEPSAGASSNLLLNNKVGAPQEIVSATVSQLGGPFHQQGGGGASTTHKKQDENHQQQQQQQQRLSHSSTPSPAPSAKNKRSLVSPLLDLVFYGGGEKPPPRVLDDDESLALSALERRQRAAVGKSLFVSFGLGLSSFTPRASIMGLGRQSSVAPQDNVSMELPTSFAAPQFKELSQSSSKNLLLGFGDCTTPSPAVLISSSSHQQQQRRRSSVSSRNLFLGLSGGGGSVAPLGIVPSKMSSRPASRRGSKMNILSVFLDNNAANAHCAIPIDIDAVGAPVPSIIDENEDEDDDADAKGDGSGRGSGEMGLMARSAMIFGAIKLKEKLPIPERDKEAKGQGRGNAGTMANHLPPNAVLASAVGGDTTPTKDKGRNRSAASSKERRSLITSNHSILCSDALRRQEDDSFSTPNHSTAPNSEHHHHQSGPTFMEEIQNRQRILAAQSALGGMRRFLVVDDCPVSRKVVTRALLKQGQEVVTAMDGLDCLRTYEDDIAAGKFFSVILMDFQMPLMNGKEATRELRARGFKNPIIGLTAGIDDYGLAKRFIDSGADAVLSKPLNIAQLELELKQIADEDEDYSETEIPLRSSPVRRINNHHRHSPIVGTIIVTPPATSLS